MRLACLWAAAVLCYAYADIIGFYLPGRIEATAAGDLGPLGKVSPAMLVAIALCMAIPSAMVALSVHLAARANRLLNMAFGILYTLMIAATIPAAPPFYWLLGSVAMALTGSIAWQAWRWPRLA